MWNQSFKKEVKRDLLDRHVSFGTDSHRLWFRKKLRD